jgi:hypothetical protein
MSIPMTPAHFGPQDLPTGDNVRCLFAGRHDIPGSPAPLFTAWDFVTNSPVYAPGYADFVRLAGSAPVIHIVVTGLTPALLHVLSDVQHAGQQLYCWHYDRDSGQYWPQLVSSRPFPFGWEDHLNEVASRVG